MSRKIRKEQDIQKAILDWLKIQRGTFAFKVTSTGIFDQKRALFRTNQHKGIADIIGVKLGKFFAFEVKNEKGKVEDHQRQWLEKVSSAGGYAAIVRSLGDAIEAFEEI